MTTLESVVSTYALLLALLTPPTTGGAPATAKPSDQSPNRQCTCPQARLQHGWCDACSVGFVATFPVDAAELYEAIHPHGHDVQPDQMRCATCRAAVPVDGWCAECNSGFVNRQAYFSKLTYLLAKGSVREPAASPCAACRGYSQRSGWCAACAVGWVGNVRFEKRDAYDEAARSLEVFFAACAASPRCVLCAQAMIMDAYCPMCRVTYRDGKPVSPTSPAPPKQDPH